MSQREAPTCQHPNPHPLVQQTLAEYHLRQVLIGALRDANMTEIPVPRALTVGDARNRSEVLQDGSRRRGCKEQEAHLRQLRLSTSAPRPAERLLQQNGLKPTQAAGV